MLSIIALPSQIADLFVQHRIRLAKTKGRKLGQVLAASLERLRQGEALARTIFLFRKINNSFPASLRIRPVINFVDYMDRRSSALLSTTAFPFVLSAALWADYFFCFQL
jgi:hypothetical protein